MKRLLSILLIFLVLGIQSPIFSEEVPSSGEMMSDVVIIRPLSIAALGVGVCLFVVALPFSAIPAERLEVLRQTSNRLVLYPFHFAFMRRVGSFPGYMEEMDLVRD